MWTTKRKSEATHQSGRLATNSLDTMPTNRRVRVATGSDEIEDTHADNWERYFGYMNIEKEMIGRETDTSVRSIGLRELVNNDCTCAATGRS